MKIRTATMADLAAVAAVEKACFRQQKRRQPMNSGTAWPIMRPISGYSSMKRGTSCPSSTAW